MGTWEKIRLMIKFYFAVKADCKERYERDFDKRWHEVLESLTIDGV